MSRIHGSNRRILVTGGAGFIGSHLIDRLLERGDEILCVDNLSTGARENIDHLRGHPRFEFLRHDVCEPLHVEVDAIYNLASPASPVHYQRDPVRTLRTSVMGALNMLGLARRLGCPIFQASTSEVYGDPAVHPQAEDYWGNVNPIGPRSCYDEGKRCAETLFFDYRRQHGLDVRVARIFNTYGPRVRLKDGRVISNLIGQALTGAPITLYGGGAQTRSFCFVDDMVEGILKLMAAEDPGGPVNLGNPEEISIADLAALILEMTGSESGLVEQPLPHDDPLRRRPDIGLARRLLGWEPRIGLRQGLTRTIAYFREIVGEEGEEGPGRRELEGKVIRLG